MEYSESKSPDAIAPTTKLNKVMVAVNITAATTKNNSPVKDQEKKNSINVDSSI